jgi:KaiC/GvpD/RAD55 family RecA-like ATPase
MMVRSPTGVSGLDPLIEGGFLKGDLVLLAGGMGCGKTIFSTQFIYNGAMTYGEKGVLVTYEEDAWTLKRNMLRFGFDLDRLEKQGMIKVVDLEAHSTEDLTSNIEQILNLLDEIEATRLAIDSLTAFLTASQQTFEYRTLMHLIYKTLKTRGCTTVMTCSVPTGAETLGLGIEEFVADAVIVLENIPFGIELKTRFNVRKMRGTNHSRRYHSVVITSKGMEIIPFTAT